MLLSSHPQGPTGLKVLRVLKCLRKSSSPKWCNIKMPCLKKPGNILYSVCKWFFLPGTFRFSIHLYPFIPRIDLPAPQKPTWYHHPPQKKHGQSNKVFGIFWSYIHICRPNCMRVGYLRKNAANFSVEGNDRLACTAWNWHCLWK